MPTTPPATRPTGSGAFARTTITIVMAVIAALAFAFSFGNVWALALRLGVSHPVAPLIAPMVDLSVVGLMVALHHLATTGTDPAQLRSATRLMHLCGLVTVVLNTADPLLAHHWGRGLLDAVAPALLLGWGKVGPDLLRPLHAPAAHAGDCNRAKCPESERSARLTSGEPDLPAGGTPPTAADEPSAEAKATPQPAPEPAPVADPEQDDPSDDEPAADPDEEILPTERDPVLGSKRTGRKPAASMDELAEIARPAVTEHGATHAVVKQALGEAGMPISSQRRSVLVQRFKDEQVAQETEALRAQPSPA